MWSSMCRNEWGFRKLQTRDTVYYRCYSSSMHESRSHPKYVVGLGSCTINGGMYWDSYNTIKRLDQYLPVDLYIAGCMPRPEALLQGFADLKKIIRSGKAEGANEYAEKFEWYKANQKRVINDWDMPDYSW